MNESEVSNNSNKSIKKAIKISPPLIAMLIAVVLFLLSGLLPAGYSTLQGAIRQALNILRLASFIAIIGAGQTLVIISGGEGIDLSAAPIVTVGALLTYMIINGQNYLILPVLLLVILIGAAIGLLNGLGVTYLKISPFVMTLVMSGVVQGALILWTKGYYDGKVAPIMTQLVARDLIWGIPGMIFIWIIIGILMTLLLERTRYGKQLFAIGVNRTAARLSGVKVNRMVILTYVLAGAMAAFSGFLLVGYTQNAGPNLGNQYLFPSIIAVAIGGTQMSGGKGSYIGTIAGAIVIQLISSLLTTMQLPQALQQIIYGSLLVVILIIYGREKGLRS
ncbi:MAG TPA: ABC transporter permease [Brevefilum fermentans]|jgi:ribose transport system permease protein|uniref:Inner-membrane translocator n=1 Tax=Candidatus Brevifilum fermentans TaxID=1986204 RepID=A0A1Y6K8V1_9CHLR|nr:ABC transporter permease [Brevefilum fermentans]MDI9565702.1 ABC transporter permease [Chloroflexota bacterium]SMX54440.1 Inner-membrane translocator [Brevefilum fermentans]HQA29536.1 ABC transporter permease [Brevefilum fermentans]